MEIAGDRVIVTPVWAEIEVAEDRPCPMIGIENFAFYDIARQAYVVTQVSERRFYGRVTFCNGVILFEE